MSRCFACEREHALCVCGDLGDVSREVGIFLGDSTNQVVSCCACGELGNGDSVLVGVDDAVSRVALDEVSFVEHQLLLVDPCDCRKDSLSLRDFALLDQQSW